MKQTKKYLKKYELKNTGDRTSQLTYLKHRDNFPLELKGTMRRKIDQKNQHKQINTGCKKMFTNERKLSDSGALLANVIQKSKIQPLYRQKKHFAPQSHLSENPQFYFRYEKTQNSKYVNQAKFQKLKHDFQDSINIQSVDLKKCRSANNFIGKQCGLQMRTGKRLRYQNNLMKESNEEDSKNERQSTRRINPCRSQSSIRIG